MADRINERLPGGDPEAVGALIESLDNLRRHVETLGRFYHHLPAAAD